MLQYWRYANSKENKIFFIEKHYKIDNQGIESFTQNGSASNIRFEHFIKVLKTSKYYLLYISKRNFIYIPIESFKSLSDKEWFEVEIVKKMK